MHPSKIKTTAEFCDFFRTEPAILDDIRKNKETLIKTIKIPKRNGGFRVVYRLPEDTFRNLLRTVRAKIADQYTFPECVQGFVRGKSIRTNASFHLGKKIVVNIDIKNFFETIPAERVRQVFVDMGFIPEYAEILTELTTVNGVLATGFSPSPILSNILCAGLDTDFLALSERNGSTYTRNGDDITISSDGTTPSIEEIEVVIAEHGFTPNRDKYRVQRKGGSQYVTGLTVCDPEQPHIPRRIKRGLRLESYYIKKYGEADHFSYLKRNQKLPRILGPRSIPYSLMGWVHYISGIDGRFANWLRRKWEVPDKDPDLHLQEMAQGD